MTGHHGPAWQPTRARSQVDEAPRLQPGTFRPDRYAGTATPPVVPDENGCYPLAMPGVTKAL